MESLVQQRPTVHVFDLYHSDVYCGSLALSKMITVVKSKLIPCICIESIVSESPNASYGTCMFDLCKQMLRTSPTPLRSRVLDNVSPSRGFRLDGTTPPSPRVADEPPLPQYITRGYLRSTRVEIDDNRPSPKKKKKSS